MPCQELFQMRKQASQIKNQMDQQRKKARIQGAQPRQRRPSGNSEYIPYLQRKLSRLADRIERHVAEHRCQE